MALEKGTAYYKKAADEARKVIEGERNGTYDIRMDENFYDVYAMSNNYNKETILGINYSPNVDWVQDSQLTSCDQFESLGGWEMHGEKSVSGRISGRSSQGCYL